MRQSIHFCMVCYCLLLIISCTSYNAFILIIKEQYLYSFASHSYHWLGLVHCQSFPSLSTAGCVVYQCIQLLSNWNLVAMKLSHWVTSVLLLSCEPPSCPLARTWWQSVLIHVWFTLWLLIMLDTSLYAKACLSLSDMKYNILFSFPQLVVCIFSC